MIADALIGTSEGKVGLPFEHLLEQFYSFLFFLAVHQPACIIANADHSVRRGGACGDDIRQSEYAGKQHELITHESKTFQAELKDLLLYRRVPVQSHLGWPCGIFNTITVHGAASTISSATLPNQILLKPWRAWLGTIASSASYFLQTAATTSAISPVSMSM